jgi:hypothetical protein
MKRNDNQITLKLAGTLRAELEEAAAAENLGLSGLIRAVLIEYAMKRVTTRAAEHRQSDQRSVVA